jgi:DHA2 family multidrug resistance protein-like MFS transporter
MADQIIAPARDAFASGLNVVALIGAILVTALTMLALTMLRHVAPTNVAAAQPEAIPLQVDAASREEQPA